MHQLGFGAPFANDLFEFGAVGRDAGGTRVARVVAAFGVNQHSFACSASGRNHLRHMSQATFAVVGEQHHVVRRQQLEKLVGLRGQHFVLWCVLKVHAQQLLLAANDAQLDGGFELAVAAQVRGDAGLGHQVFEQVAGFVIPHHRQQRGMRAQAHDVVGHVGATAQTVFFTRDAHHGHGGFGADAVDSAIPVAVEHDIAND